jgi:cell division protein FtsB
MARKRNRVSHGKEAFYIICILVLVLVCFVGYFGPGGFRDLQKSQRELATRQEHIEELNRENEELRQSTRALQNDRQAQERYARQKGYAKKGEIVQEVPSQDPAPSHPKK